MQIYRNAVHSKAQKGSVKMIGAYLKAYMKEKGIKQSFIATSATAAHGRESVSQKNRRKLCHTRHILKFTI